MFPINSDTVVGSKESFALKSQGFNLENFDCRLLAPLGSHEGKIYIINGSLFMFLGLLTQGINLVLFVVLDTTQ